MNFLAHIYLSGNNKETTIGNFIGDFVKGKQTENYTDPIKNGILLHRHIDQFTDSHPVVLESKKRLRPTYRHYSPVITDVFYDHFLAVNWNSFSNEDLEEFTLDFYSFANQYKDIFPERAQRMFYYMEKDNWLFNYRLKEGIGRALTGMSRRTAYDSKMDQAQEDLEKDYDKYQEEFNEFFPDLISSCKSYLQENND